MPNEQRWQLPHSPWNPGNSEPDSLLGMLHAPMDSAPPLTNYHPNENAPPSVHAPAKHPIQHPPAPPAPPFYDPTFVQYHDPRAGAPVVKHRPALQADTQAYHLNVHPGNPAVPAAYGYDGPRQMRSNDPARSRGEVFAGQVASWPPNQDGAPGVQANVPDWQAYTGMLDLRAPAGAAGGEQSARVGGQKRRGREAREVFEEPGLSGSDDDGSAKKKKKKNSAPVRKGGSKRKTKADEKGKARARGAGSKSGNLHRRHPGASDDEVAELPAAAKHAAEPRLSNAQRRELEKRADLGSEVSDQDGIGEDEDNEDGDDGSSEPKGSSAEDDDVKKCGLNDTEKLQAVEYLTAPERYEQIRTSLSKFCIEIAQRLFKDRVQAGQIRNYWNNNAFAKYKAIRPQVSHTGGGDPDAARSQSPAQPGSGERPQKTTDITFKATGKFSSEILHAFYESKLYDLIDAVAHSDSAVERSRKINSFDPVSDSGSTKKRRAHLSESPEKNTGTDDTFLQQAFRDIAERSKQAQKFEQERLALARRREEREDAERLERQEIRRQQERRERQVARGARWTLAVEMTKSPIEEVRTRALQLMARLEQEEQQEEHAAANV